MCVVDNMANKLGVIKDLELLKYKAQKLHDLLNPRDEGDIQDELKSMISHCTNAIGLAQGL